MADGTVRPHEPQPVEGWFPWASFLGCDLDIQYKIKRNPRAGGIDSTQT
jgi:hypothetical protein